MTTLAVDKPRAYGLGDINDLPVIATDIVYEGAAVGDNGSGYARPLVAGDPFRGIAQTIADNAAGAAGAINVRVRQRGSVQLPVSGAAITDVGKAIYASDDDTFTLTATSNSFVGRVSRWISTGVVMVDFDASRGGVGSQVALTENAGAIGGSNDGDLPDLTATYVARTGSVTGTANGALEAEGTLSTGNTYSDAAVNTVLAKIENNIAEAFVVIAQLAADNVALRAAIRENATKVNSLIAELK